MSRDDPDAPPCTNYFGDACVAPTCGTRRNAAAFRILRGTHDFADIFTQKILRTGYRASATSSGMISAWSRSKVRGSMSTVFSWTIVITGGVPNLNLCSRRPAEIRLG